MNDYDPRKHKVVVDYDRDKEKFVAKCPSLPGVYAEASTRAASVLNVEELINSYMAGVEADARATRVL